MWLANFKLHVARSFEDVGSSYDKWYAWVIICCCVSLWRGLCKVQDKMFHLFYFFYFNALLTVLNMCLERRIVTLIHYFKHRETMYIPALILYLCLCVTMSSRFLLFLEITYILESNPHPFYTFRGLKNQIRIRIACGLDSRSWAGFWQNDRAAVRAVRTIQYNYLSFYLLFIILYNILYNIYNLLFIRLAVITHNRIAIRHPVTIIFIFTIVLP